LLKGKKGIIFGGQFDFILHSIGMSPNVRKDIPYEQTSYENMLKTFDISALSFHRILQTAYKLDAIKEWGSVVALS
jgi:enoyl-[acyl-carrier protein] reductase I